MSDAEAITQSDAVANVEQPGSADEAQKTGSKRDPSKVFVSNASDLKQEAPEVWDAMIRAAARDICDDLKKHAERMKKIMREGQRR